ncbi:hypothetical protein BH10ACI2_BH10ACI2_01730 [soil metagenome]
MGEKIETSSETVEGEKDSLLLKDHLISALYYSIFAIAVYFAGRFSWWFGFVLFVVFIFYILTHVILHGFVIFIQVFVAFLMAKVIRTRGMKLDRVDELKQPLGALLKTNVLSAVLSIYVILLTVALAGFFSFGWFS